MSSDRLDEAAAFGSHGDQAGPREDGGFARLPLPIEVALRALGGHALFMLDAAGRLASWNEGVQAAFGWADREWIGRPWSILFAARRDGPDLQALLSRAAQDGAAQLEAPLIGKDGKAFAGAIALTRVAQDAGEASGFVAVASDRTQLAHADAECRRRLDAERAARAEAEHRAAELDAALENIPEAVYLGDEHGIRRCNAHALEMLGVSSVEELRHPIGELGRRFEVRHGRQGRPVPPHELPFARALRGEPSVLEAWTTNAATGEPVFVRSSAAPIVIDGRTVGAIAVNCDLTRTKRVESALSEREQQFKALLNGVRDYAIFAIDPDGLIASWHVGAMLMKGYTADEAIGMPFANLFVPQERDAGRAQLEMQIAAATGQFKGEGVRLRKDGTRFHAFVVLTATRGPDGELLGYLKLTQDITEIKRREGEREQLLRAAQAAREDAERANRMKNEFLATISHELRTPLGAILGWSRLLERGLHDAQGIQQGLAAISRNAAVQSRLIDDLLDMARIESGTLRLELAPVEVASVIAAGIEATAPAAAAKRIALRTRIDPHTPPVMADAQRLQQVVWNLLSNAIKFSPEEGSVSVGARPKGAGVELTVADNGQGIDASFLPHVFDRFRQHDSSITRRQGGLGLGLSIVKQLVELHGGRVRAESPGDALGSTFVVELPSALPNLLSRAGADRRHEMAGEPVAPAAHRLRGVKVLVVDDEPDALEVAKQVLQRAGASVIQARDASEGLEALKLHRPDALLSDVGMPIHDGFELITWVRGLAPEQGGATPAAAITAYASAEDRERAMRSGFQLHVAKPLEFDTWIRTVEQLVNGRR